MGKLLAFVGRALIGMLFVAAGVDKLAKFDLGNDNSDVAYMGPKLDLLIGKLQNATQVDVPIEKEHYPYLVLAAGAAEVGGGILFIFGSTLGAVVLMGFLLVISPVMHNFWDEEPGTEAHKAEMINFLKNMGLFGGLLAYVAKPAPKVKID